MASDPPAPYNLVSEQPAGLTTDNQPDLSLNINSSNESIVANPRSQYPSQPQQSEPFNYYPYAPPAITIPAPRPKTTNTASRNAAPPPRNVVPPLRNVLPQPRIAPDFINSPLYLPEPLQPPREQYSTINYYNPYLNPYPTTKLDYPVFSNEGKVTDWLRKVEQYFGFHQIEERFWVDFCSFYLNKEPMRWYNRYTKSVQNHRSWHVFKEEIILRFNHEEMEMPYEALVGSVSSYDQDLQQIKNQTAGIPRQPKTSATAPRNYQELLLPNPCIANSSLIIPTASPSRNHYLNPRIAAHNTLNSHQTQEQLKKLLDGFKEDIRDEVLACKPVDFREAISLAKFFEAERLNNQKNNKLTANDEAAMHNSILDSSASTKKIYSDAQFLSTKMQGKSNLENLAESNDPATDELLERKRDELSCGYNENMHMGHQGKNQVCIHGRVVDLGNLIGNEEEVVGKSKDDETAADHQLEPLLSNSYTTVNPVRMPTVHRSEPRISIPSAVEFDDVSGKSSLETEHDTSNSNVLQSSVGNGESGKLKVEDKHVVPEIDNELNGKQFNCEKLDGQAKIDENISKEKIKEDKNATNGFDSPSQIIECILASNSTMTNNAYIAFEWHVCCRKHYNEVTIFIFDPGGDSLAGLVEL